MLRASHFKQKLWQRNAIVRRTITFKCRAMVVNAEGGKLTSREIIETDTPLLSLPRQDPLANLFIKVQYSTLNYKDGMIINGVRGVVPSFQ